MTLHRPNATAVRRTALALLLPALAGIGLLLSAPRASADDIGDYRDRPFAWFETAEGEEVIANVLARQQASGGWWKNYDPTVTPDDKDHSRGTFDNGATTDELRLLARAYRVTNNAACRIAFDRGLAAALAAQYGNGGFPQQFPPSAEGYDRHITFNDHAMVNVLRLLRDVAAAEGDFAFVTPDQQRAAADAFGRGIACILDAQVIIDGQPTAWCAQHDAATLKPAAARSYELPSLSGSESANLVMLLMELDEPSDRVQRAVRAAVAWFDTAKLEGIRTERVEAPSLPDGFDVRVVQDEDAAPLWARFYDLDTGQPFFCGRDGVKKDALADIEAERRTGYAWYGSWGQKVLDAYPAWAERVATRPAPVGSGASGRHD